MGEARALAKSQGKPYMVKMDKITKTWRIYDLNDPVWDTLTQDDDVPNDDHPCVTILTESAFFEVMKEANSINLLPKMNFSGDDKNNDELDKLKEEILDKDKKIIELNSKLSLSEGAKIKMEGMDKILKIIAMDSVQR